MLRLTMVDDGDPAPRFSGRRPTREGMDLKKNCGRFKKSHHRNKKRGFL